MLGVFANVCNLFLSWCKPLLVVTTWALESVRFKNFWFSIMYKINTHFCIRIDAFLFRIRITNGLLKMLGPPTCLGLARYTYLVNCWSKAMDFLQTLLQRNIFLIGMIKKMFSSKDWMKSITSLQLLTQDVKPANQRHVWGTLHLL